MKTICTLALVFFLTCAFGQSNVGIGLQNPGGKLHILDNSGTSTPHLRLTEDQLDFARIKFENTAEPTAFWDIAGLSREQLADSKLNFYYSGPNGTGDRLTILGNGNVGFGKTNPEARLDMPGGNWDLAGGSAGDLRIGSAGTNFRIGTSIGGTVRLYATGGTNTMHLGTDNANRLTIDNVGNVGIGTTVPSERLHVSGGFRVSGLAGSGDRNVIVDSQGKFKIGAVGNSDTDWIETSTAVYNNAKNIGIGTQFPSRPLTVFGEADSTAINIFTPFSGVLGGRSLEVNGYGIDAYGSGFLTFYDADLLLQTKSTGNVGIGTSSGLASKLTIEGPDNNGTIAALEIRSIGNGQTMLIDGNEIDITTGNLHINAASGRPVSIGTFQIASGYQLTVKGKVMAEEVRVQLQAAWPDYVFDTDYALMPLTELEQKINEQGHLPGIPAAHTLEEEGIDTGEMQRKMMEKIEELTLHVIALNKEIEQLKSNSNK